MEYLQLLGLDYGASKEEIKKAYFNKIKEFPPELYEDEFIELTSAYEYLIRELKNMPTYNVIDKSQVEINELFSDIISTIENGEEFYIFINKLSTICKIINLDNFTYVNELALRIITVLRKENFSTESLILTVVIGESFKNIGLENLFKSYKELERVLILNRF